LIVHVLLLNSELIRFKRGQTAFAPSRKNWCHWTLTKIHFHL